MCTNLFIFSVLQEVILTEEQLQPELLNILDEVFEFDFPLGRATVDHKSEVNRRFKSKSDKKIRFIL